MLVVFFPVFTISVFVIAFLAFSCRLLITSISAMFLDF